ncbi:MAG TPA: DNA-formamidopyrimidine glycosylase family protein [Steroidobacteraceae bacterium]|jgi:endonuclease-8|nr:DNA-formamidopyrimidine glycosylase family protein [Steroidobacteraceae bacterium]
MPEGPSIVIFREETAKFVGQTILRVDGNTKIEKERLLHQRVLDIRSWGKHYLMVFDGFSLRVHFMLFGSYRIDERRDSEPRLSMRFKNGELNLYACSVQFIEGDLDNTYDWSSDVMSDAWDAEKAREKLLALPNAYACDAMLNQNVFSGVGNIIKNEVLFRIRVHPLSLIGSLSSRKLNELISQARQYSFEFLEWKKAYVLRKHWLAHTKSICPRCNIPFSKGKLGRTQRRSFYCERCQKLYAVKTAAVKKPVRSSKKKKAARRTTPA